MNEIGFDRILPILPYLFAGLFVLAMLVAVLVALVRGMTKSRIRFIILAVCLLVAFVATWAFKNGASSLFPQMEEALKDVLTSEPAKEVYKWISGSEPLQETMTGFAVALVAPLFFFIAFIILRIVTWVIYLIVMLIVGGEMKKNDSQKKLHTLRAVALGVVQGALIFFVLMTPLYAYLNVTMPIAQSALEQEEVQNAVNGKVDSGAIRQMLKNTENNFFFSAYGKLGGGLTCNFLTSFSAGGEKTNAIREMRAIGSLATEAFKLKDLKGVESLDEEKAAVIGGLVNNLGDSKLMQTVAGELIYAVTDAWQNGRPAFGIEKPKLDPTVEELFQTILKDFHADARDSKKLNQDFQTLGEMLSIMAKADLFRNIAGENANSDQLVESFAEGTVIKDLISALGKNETLKNLISELANVGMRAIGTSVLNLPENAAEIFEDYIEKITATVNRVLAANATYEEKVDMLAAEMLAALEESGLEIKLDESVAKLYSDAILSDIREAGLSQITPDDVREFFEIAAQKYEESQEEGTAPLAARRGVDKKEYKSSLYGGMTGEQLLKSGVAKLVRITSEIAGASEQAADEREFQTLISQIVQKYSVSVDLSGLSKGDFTPESLKAVSSITAETFPSVLVTMQDLLIDTQKASEKINEKTIEAEAEKIAGIFRTALEVKDTFRESSESFDLDRLSGVASKLGNVLDSIDSTETFGGKTELMITAIFQKEEVATSMDIDISTAAELAKAATEPVNGVATDYTATMESVSSGAAIASKLKDPEGKITEEDVQTLLKTMTPQTANMLKVYLTEERVGQFGIFEKAVKAATKLLGALFEEMADKEKYPDYSSETAAMLKMFDVAKAATKSDGHNLFNHGDDRGVLGMSSDETVELVMNSDMVCNAVVKAMYLGDAIDPEMVNPFGLVLPTDGSDYQECEAAIERYYGAHPDSKTILKALAAFFGVEADFLN
ncbi:MAG: hypothetical protein E7680_00550 [Ruminococcaceae bacterium]|nr:hypothetical protein [Oscillospiraceae bacterium]